MTVEINKEKLLEFALLGVVGAFFLTLFQAPVIYALMLFSPVPFQENLTGLNIGPTMILPLVISSLFYNLLECSIWSALVVLLKQLKPQWGLAFGLGLAFFRGLPILLAAPTFAFVLSKFSTDNYYPALFVMFANGVVYVLAAGCAWAFVNRMNNKIL